MPELENSIKAKNHSNEDKEVFTMTNENTKAKENTQQKNSNIIGNTIYKFIPQKTYTKIDKAIMQDVVDRLKSEKVKFSGRINTEDVTLTFSKNDAEKVYSAIATAKKSLNQDVNKQKEPEKTNPQKSKSDKANIIGNTEFTAIENKTYRKFEKDIGIDIANRLEAEGIKFSGRIADDTATVTLTFANKDLEKVNKAIDEASKAVEVPFKNLLKNINKHYIFYYNSHSLYEQCT